MNDPLSMLMSDLSYLTYAHNRDKSPDVIPERWEKVFGPEVWSFEARYQAEKAIEKAKS